jgi:hypothetical protein
MASDPYTRVQLDGAVAFFLLGPDDNPATVESVDVNLLVDGDGEWTATMLTIAEVQRLMRVWRTTGECLGGRFFQCRDLVLIDEPGLTQVVEILGELVRSGEYRDVLVQVPPEQ